MDTALNWLCQGALVGASSFVMLVALRRAGANVRSAVCWATLVAILALPVLPSGQTAPVASGVSGASTGAALVSLPDAWWTSTLLLLGLWTVWAGAHAVRFIAAVAAVRRARALSRPFPPDVESRLPHWVRVRATGRRAALVVSESVASAAVLGWGAPSIAVAPSLVEALDADDLDRIVIHEWVHVQRRDDVVNLVMIGVRLIAGWHPALWWLDRRLRIEREIACDEATVAITGSPKRYAACLVKLAALGPCARANLVAPAALASSDLRTRIVQIVSKHRMLAPLWSRSMAAGIVAVLSLLTVGLGGLPVVEAAVLALPIVPARAHHAVDRLTPLAPPAFPTQGETRDPQRPAADPAAVDLAAFDRAPAVETPLPLPEIKLLDAVAFDTAGAHQPAIPAAPAPGLTLIPVGARAADLAPARPAVDAEKVRMPWDAAAAGGVAIGRKSKEAGLATAGFFTRVARRVAGSF